MKPTILGSFLLAEISREQNGKPNEVFFSFAQTNSLDAIGFLLHVQNASGKQK